MYGLEYFVLLFSVGAALLFLRYQVPALLWGFFILSVAAVWLRIADTTTGYIFFGATLIGVVLIGSMIIPPVRRFLFTQRIFNRAKLRNVRIPSLEKQALSAGEAGFEAGYFAGTPDWNALHNLPAQQLSEKENAFINGPIEEYCKIIDDWDIRSNRRIPDAVWKFAEEHNFSGLRVGEKWGGADFSFQAQSLILSKVASRSVDAAVLIELPTSLYPDELIEEYGTDKQKNYYLPRLAEGKEIVSFAVTGAQGSDVGSMPDSGVVEYGTHEGKEVLGLTLNFNKRFITLAPKASLIVLAFSLSDPNNHLKSEQNSGITLALIPANHPGVDTSKRHYPAGLAFPHGPVTGKDVFIPMEWVIGAETGIGLGWKMIIQCLFVGRCLAIPSISVGAITSAFRTTTAYAAVRRQFGLSLNTFEGVQSAVAQLTELTYKAESARLVAAALVDSGKRPLAVSAIMKYKLTEYSGYATNHALDVHAGRGICDGPSNYLLSAYNAAPIGVTVEGSNIVTRSVITFAQGVLQGHPFLRQEIESFEHDDSTKGIIEFDTVLAKHVSLFLSNCTRSLFGNLTFGILSTVPKGVPTSVAHWYKQISRYSISFSVLSDMTILLLSASLKKQQKLSGRLADVLSELYLLSAVLKRYKDDGYPDADYPIVQQCMENGLHRIETDLQSAIANFPQRAVRPFLHLIIFPLGAWKKTASDTLSNDVAQLVSKPGPVRDRLSGYSYISNDPEDKTGRLEVALELATQADPIYKKMRAATREGILIRKQDQITDALEKDVISPAEAQIVQKAAAAAAKAVAVDSCEQDSYSNPLV